MKSRLELQGTMDSRAMQLRFKKTTRTLVLLFRGKLEDAEIPSKEDSIFVETLTHNFVVFVVEFRLRKMAAVELDKKT